MTLAYVGLGSNLDNPRARVRLALQELAGLRRTRLVAGSSLYRSAPVGFTAQPDFVNAVAALQTELSAPQLLGELQLVEARHDRTRSFADAPRTLDLDLLLFGDETIKTKELTVPHPRMHERAFVLKPLVEISPQAQIPGRGPARTLLDACAGQDVQRID